MNALSGIRTNHRETANDYRHVIFQHGNLRVVECRDRIQWLLQRRTHAESPAGARWANLGCCVRDPESPLGEKGGEKVVHGSGGMSLLRAA